MRATRTAEHGATRSLTRERYVSDEAFADDMDTLFSRSWLYAGHVSQIPAPGDYLLFELGDESVIVVRGEEGRIHAHFNVCRHRGSRICDAPSGSTRRLVCPYHQWVYALDGRLTGAPRMDATFDPSAHGLRPVGVVTWHGSVFVNLFGEDTPPVDELLADREADVRRYRLQDAKVARTIVYDVAANWKLIMENELECYHCSVSHRELCRVIDLEGFLRSGGHEARLRPGMRSLTTDGELVSRRLLGVFGEGAPLDDPHATDWCGWSVFPGTFAIVFPDHEIVFAFAPVAPLRTRVTCQWLVAGDAVEGVDYDADRVAELWDVTNRQDWELCERNQRGVLSRTYVPGPHSLDGEAGIQRFLTQYREALALGDGA